MSKVRPHHTSGWKKTERWRRTDRWQRTFTNRGLILEDRGLPHLVISHTCSEMGSSHSWRKTKSPEQYRERKKDTQKQKKREEQNGLDCSEKNLKKVKGELLSVLILTWKKCLFDHWVIENKETVQTQTLQWKPSVTEQSPGNKYAHTQTQ